MNHSQQEQITRAASLVQQAKIKMPKQGFLSKFFSNSLSDYEDAAQLFVKAGNLYKVSKMIIDAVEAYQQAIECYNAMTMSNKSTSYNHDYEINNVNLQIAEARIVTNPLAAVSYYQKVVNYFANACTYDRAAKYCEVIGEIYRVENQVDESIKCYRMASDMYNLSNQPVAMNKSKEAVANVQIGCERWNDAYETMMEVVHTCSLPMNVDKFKYHLPDHLFKTGLLGILANKKNADLIEITDGLMHTRYHEILIKILDWRSSDRKQWFWNVCGQQYRSSKYESLLEKIRETYEIMTITTSPTSSVPIAEPILDKPTNIETLRTFFRAYPQLQEPPTEFVESGQPEAIKYLDTDDFR